MTRALANMWLRWRWMTVPLGIFAATRVVAGIFLTIGAGRQVALTETTSAYKVTVPTPASPGYLGVVSNWDGQWLRSIAENGYPLPLPTVDGRVVASEWAFSPGYPMLVRLVMWLSGLEFPMAASLVSISCSGVAIVVLYGLLRHRGDAFSALTVVLALCCFPAAPVLQVAYTEGLTLLLLVAALGSLAGRRYVWFALAALGLALTRPLMVPLAGVLVLHSFLRWRGRGTDSFPTRERVTLATLTIVVVALVGLWPITAGLIAETPNAFAGTISAWPGNQGGHGMLTNWLTLSFSVGAVGMFVAVLVAVIGYAVLRPRSSFFGVELRAWSLVYPLYMLALTRPNAGIVRYLLLSIGTVWPLAEVKPHRETRVEATMRWLFPLLFAVLGLVGQYYWVTRVFTIDESPATQPYP